MSDYLFHPKLVLRIPALPVSKLNGNGIINKMISDEFFLKGLYVASPVLYEKLMMWKSGKHYSDKDTTRMFHSLSKYIIRMHSRCTPFGLFAGCSVVSWGAADQLVIDKSSVHEHRRFDMSYITGLARHLEKKPTVIKKLLYYPNNSLYNIGDELRYVELYTEEGEHVYHISSVECSDILTEIISFCKSGKLFSDITNFLTNKGINEDDAVGFVMELVKAQVLMSEISPNVTGEEFDSLLIRKLNEIYKKTQDTELQTIVRTLESASEVLKKNDPGESDLTWTFSETVKILEQIKDYPCDKSKLFQVDLFNTTKDLKLDSKHQNNITEAIEILHKLTVHQQNSRLEKFKKRFSARYEGKEIPLPEALDTETGIGYNNIESDSLSPLLNGIVLPEQNSGSTSVINLTATQQYLNDKITEAVSLGNNEIQLVPHEIKHLAENHSLLPLSLPVMFRIYNRDTIVLEEVGGSGATNIISRFGHGNAEIERIAREISDQEQKTNPEVIFTEIVHLPEQRIGNILLRPVIRNFEIPYLAASGVDNDHQILPDDIMVSLRDNQIVLRSKKLNKRIIPRLSSAHNYMRNSLPLYHFLCDLQTQDFQSHLNLRLRHKELNLPFIPRISYKNVILKPATWLFNQNVVKNILGYNAGNLKQCVQKLRLPERFVLLDGDRKLLVDTNDEWMTDLFLETIKHRSSIHLQESIIDTKDGLVKDQEDQFYAHQFIAFLQKSTPHYTPQITTGKESSEKIIRNFSIGSEWLYYKFYCGVQSSDKVLIHAIKPLVASLIESGLINKWFFIRYADPDHHLRVRFHIKDLDKIGTIINKTKEYILPFKNIGLIWKIQTDTYNRELERYGWENIIASEDLFFYDSTQALQVISQIADSESEINDSWLFALAGAHQLICLFKLTLEERVNFTMRVKASFSQEFNMGKDMKLQIDRKFRNYREEINKRLSIESNVMTPNHLQQLIQQIRESTREDKHSISVFRLLGSYIHMHINRIIPTDQRLHEFIIFDFLNRYNKSQVAIQKKVVTEKN